MGWQEDEIDREMSELYGAKKKNKKKKKKKSKGKKKTQRRIRGGTADATPATDDATELNVENILWQRMGADTEDKGDGILLFSKTLNLFELRLTNGVILIQKDLNDLTFIKDFCEQDYDPDEDPDMVFDLKIEYDGDDDEFEARLDLKNSSERSKLDSL
ncbi:MAG: hypothetical protein CME61_09820 [Halobacteriovoraceae bacterium]|nr:hypothetical protein [Halobacteriovoraceae bacterium]